MTEYFAANEDEMVALGSQLWGQFRKGDVVFLIGDLGMGKTTLARGILRAAGCKESVKSPTFSLFHVYDLDIPIVHADLYRVRQGEDLGLEEYLADHVLLVEWPENWLGMESYPRKWEISISQLGDGRKLSVKKPLGESY